MLKSFQLSAYNYTLYYINAIDKICHVQDISYERYIHWHEPYHGSGELQAVYHTY